jgi:transglutaminase-like putative cysteine protease
MLLVDRTQQIIVLVLVACSGWLLGIGQQNFNISMLAVTAAVLSFVFNDCLRWIRFNRWIANVVALAVTAVALRGFFSADSPQQLLMIANLLIYLQIVLLFQVKTPRVYWQILVLSLLQIVVAAAFNISLEGGIVFLCYLLISAVAMVILQVHSHTHRIRSANRRTARQIRTASQKPDSAPPRIVAMHDQIYPNRKPLQAMIRQVFAVGIVSIAFAVVTFYLVPREEIVWTGSQIIGDPTPGFSRTMELEENVQIYLSSEVVLYATYFSPALRRDIELPEPPYLRGMPLPELYIRNNQTRWRSPPEGSYNSAKINLPGRKPRNYLIQSITLQPTSDPLLHTMFPAMRLETTPVDMEWVVGLSLLCRSPEFLYTNAMSYEYDLAIPTHSDNRPYDAFPQHSPMATQLQRLENRPDEYAQCTFIDRSRYPGLIRTAERIVATMPNRDDPIEVSRRLCDYLAIDGGFSYTLDFSDFNWDPNLDHIEDFVINKRRGHCEFFASALVLMLRSQGIPSRVVVGYHGGDFDDDATAVIVRKRHAHAWVEAYIGLEDCPQQWLRSGQASGAGAWLRLDPTPPSANDAIPNTTALVAAQDFWNMYVMGLNSAKQRDSLFQSLLQNPFQNIAEMFSLRYWRIQWGLFLTRDQWYKSSVFYAFIVLGLIAAYRILASWRGRDRNARSRLDSLPRTSSFKRFLGAALSLVAPRLGRWVSGEEDETVEVPFYQRFLRIMQRSGHRRSSSQTAREFALSLQDTLQRHQESAALQSAIDSIVDKFYWVRFSERDLSDDEMREVEASLNFLEQNFSPLSATS